MEDAPALGAYGLRIVGLTGAGDLLVPAPDHWTGWRVGLIQGPARERVGRRIDDDGALIDLDGAGTLAVDRAAATATVTAPDPPPARALVHPYLGAVAALVSRWGGAASFHCGGLIAGGAVWGVLGERGRGKSTLLASLAARGAGVLSDDLLVVRDGVALAGPRCVDLREDAARATGLGHDIGIVGGRVRYRVKLEQVPPEAPMAGWVVLAWGDAIKIRPLAAAARLPALLENVTITPTPPDPSELLDLAALPMLELARPRDLMALAETGDALIDAVRTVA